MKRARQVSVKMIPAMEMRGKSSKIGDIGLVPAVRAEVTYGKASLHTVGVIDPGADVSCLDKGLFELLPARIPKTRQVVLGATGARSVPIYQLNITIRGERKREELNFQNVPVAVIKLGRPVLLIGRRGVLEWLRVELNFPRGEMKLIFPRGTASGYPAVAAEFPAFDSAWESFRAGRTAEGIRVLALDMERFLDRVIMREEKLRWAVKDGRLSHWTLLQKLQWICEEGKISGLTGPTEEFVQARNLAVHSVAESWVKELSIQSVLRAAEMIVTRLSTKVAREERNS